MLQLPTRRLTNISPSKAPYTCDRCLHRLQRVSISPFASSQFHNGAILQKPADQPYPDPKINPYPYTHIRKELNQQARLKKKSGRKSDDIRSLFEDKWESTIGIEIHAELNTTNKLFSSALTSSSDVPNTHVALFDAAFPGAQPQFQKETLIPAIRAALALNCRIRNESRFDRKHYFYADQPNGYQITQYYEPFAHDGHITLYKHDGIDPDDGDFITVGIKQIQLEQDTAKTMNYGDDSGIDFNRVSHPLIEIITLPHVHSPATAAALVRKIQGILQGVDACVTGMELGGLRADVNVSVRKRHPSSFDVPVEYTSYHGVQGLGTRTEIKNLSSTKAVADAINAERFRQVKILEDGGVVQNETRGWTLGSSKTSRLRSKEGEVDYRYMPDPDIAPLIIDEDLVEYLRHTLPSSPENLVDKLVSENGLTTKDAKTLMSFDDGDRLDYYYDVVEHLRETLSKTDQSRLGSIGKWTGNWILMELGGLVSKANVPFTQDLIPSNYLADLMAHLIRAEISSQVAKAVLSDMVTVSIDTQGKQIPHPTTIIKEQDLFLVPMPDEDYRRLAEEVVASNVGMAKDVRRLCELGADNEKMQKTVKGKIMWFVGKMINMQKGKAAGSIEAIKATEFVREVIFREETEEVKADEGLKKDEEDKEVKEDGEVQKNEEIKGNEEVKESEEAQETEGVKENEEAEEKKESKESGGS